MTMRIGIVLFTWALSFILYRKNKTVPFIRWVSFVIFLAGSTTFATCIQLYLLPFIRTNFPQWGGLIEFLHLIIAVFAYICIYFFPYAVLMSCIDFSEWFSRRWRNLLKWILLIPIIPLSLTDNVKIYPVVEYSFKYINIYTGIYILTGCLLLYFSILKIKHDGLVDGNRKRTIYFYTSMVMWIGFSNYINVDRFWLNETGSYVETIYLDIYKVQNIFYTIVYILMLSYIIIAAKHGLFGIQLKIEKQKLDHTMKSLSIGTNFLNHTIKNEIQKLNYLGDRTKGYISSGRKDQAIDALDTMFHVIEHMQNMVDSIRERTEEIYLNERSESLISMIDTTLSILKPAIEEKKIKIERKYAHDVYMNCDKLHMSEVINNIIMNALEAMEAEGGVLEIRLFTEKKNIVVEFIDNGCGLTNESLSKVFDPFFTTKKNPQSYGLGLSYCYAAVQKHQGSLTITSSGVKKGTTVSIKLPLTKIIQNDQKPSYSFNVDNR